MKTYETLNLSTFFALLLFLIYLNSHKLKDKHLKKYMHCFYYYNLHFLLLLSQIFFINTKKLSLRPEQHFFFNCIYFIYFCWIENLRSLKLEFKTQANFFI